MNISSNISSIQAHMTLMGNNAHNIANVNTDRFVPNEGNISESDGGNVRAHLSATTDSGSQTSQTDLSKELPDQVVIEKAVAANVTAVRTQDEMYGSLLDIKA